ncbi:hypothetical protein DFP72DRAFT_635452 [Ephemerocybe angulata]|uniref:Uncharacterized protein n=1 Tax=Ephemerocybe angulata TaxID=980116 RepID=A0A8H6HIH9_9AGAR|nr:hypothetical protein DFP72DRAFT_635452 [Tulosesus angulatus]
MATLQSHLRPHRSSRVRSSSMYNPPPPFEPVSVPTGPAPRGPLQLHRPYGKVKVRQGVWKSDSPYHPYMIEGPSVSTTKVDRIGTTVLKASNSDEMLRTPLRKKVVGPTGPRLPHVRPAPPPPSDLSHTEDPSMSSTRPQHRSESDPSLRSSGSNPEVERILAQPTLLKSAPQRRPRANTMDSAIGGAPYRHATTTDAKVVPVHPFPDLSSNLPPIGESRGPVDHTNRPPRLYHTTTTPVSSSGSEYSSDNLSIPPFYSNPRATKSDKTVDTLRTLDTMAVAIRGLGPVHTPTIGQLSKRKSKRRRPKVRDGDTDVAHGGGSVKNEPRFLSQERARELVTPSPLALSPNPVGLPPVPSKRSSVVSETPKVPFPQPPSTQDVAPVKMRTGMRRTRVDSEPRQGAPSTVTRRIPRIPPPPLTLAPPTTRNRKVLRQSRASSLTVPLSPALSTVSTIAAIIAKPKKPSEKELRRRRFLKLTRTLGEDIPPELLVNNLSGAQIRDSVVVNFSESNSKSGSAPKNRRRISFSVDENGPRLNTQFPLSTTFEVSDSPNVLRKLPSIRRRDGPPAPALSSPITPTDPSPSAPYFEDHPFRIVIEDTSGPVSPTTRAHAPRDSVYSIRDDIPWMRASLALPISFDTPFIEYAGVANVMRDEKGALIRGVSPGLLDVGDPRGVYRREKRQGWSGEWNQPHIQDVIEKLRQL